MTATLRTSLLVVGVIAACGDDGSSGAQPLFPVDYAASYVEVRDCRPSGDHDLKNVRIVVDPLSVDAYQLRDRPFATGAVVLKEEHDFGDASCSDPPVGWTVMVRLPTGSSPATLDWEWQRVDGEGTVMTQNEPRCIGCHTACGVPPDGYQGTCSIP